MNLSTAHEIVDYWYGNRKIDAIKTLRYETKIGLHAAKNFLDDEGANGSENLLKSLCYAFVQSPEDQLTVLREQRRQLDIQIAQLESETYLPDVHPVDPDAHLTEAEADVLFDRSDPRSS